MPDDSLSVVALSIGYFILMPCYEVIEKVMFSLSGFLEPVDEVLLPQPP